MKQKKECRVPKTLDMAGAIQKMKVSDRPVLVQFFAEWCAACAKAKSPMNEAACELQDTVETVRIDVDKLPILAQEFDVDSLPTVALIHKGNVIGRTTGSQSAASYLKQAKKWLTDSGFTLKLNPE